MEKKNSHAAADNPLLKVKSNSELEKQAALAAARDLSQAGDLPLLTSYLLGVWEEHRRAREPWTEIMLKCRRQREGIYEAEVLQAIRKFGGSEEFMRLTARKCQAAESWICESLII